MNNTILYDIRMILNQCIYNAHVHVPCWGITET